MSKKKKDKCKMKVISKIQMMWDEMKVPHESSIKKLLKLTFDQLWEKQMDITYVYAKSLKKEKNGSKANMGKG